MEEKKGLIEKMKNALRSKPFLVLNYLSHFKEEKRTLFGIWPCSGNIFLLFFCGL